ncbi:cytochrome P450 [Dactylonectria estremocensis]|uniref:Cytochrome P450 n=1 Tax=Dactylonectria estremocensis TaxID=1079267 RepID=A0A9P9DGV8_9HYPO|nr:cytochrome P450 [Dactylonectria estremocensis]
MTVYLSFPSRSNLKHLPFLNTGKNFSLLNVEAKRTFVFHSKELFAKARKLFPKKPYRMITDLGEIVFLPIQLADEIRNDPRLSFGSAFAQDFHGSLPGFQGAAVHSYNDQILQTIVRKQLTKSIAQVIEPMSVEAVLSLSQKLGDSEEWQEIELKAVVLDVVARLSTRVFLGEELCRNEDWLRATKEYTVNFFVAGTHLRMIPRPLRPLLHWFVPKCRELRASFNESRRIIMPVIERRRAARAATLAAGEKVPEFYDAIEWADQEAATKGVNYDPATLQLMLAVAAIHTTADLVTQFTLELALNPEYFAPLREEIVHVLRTEGWRKSALHDMKLLDSALKEAQRHKPPGLASMRRRVEEPLTLSNGLTLQVGDRIAIDTYRMGDPELHQNPDNWDPYRFIRMSEQPGKAKFAQLVVASPDHLAFGYGEHACPGRFFAAYEIKIILCHLLLKYDWELVPGTDTSPRILGFTYATNPTARVRIRRRQEVKPDIGLL